MRALLLLVTLFVTWSRSASADCASPLAKVFVPSQVAQGNPVSFAYCLGGDCRGVRVEVRDGDGAPVPGAVRDAYNTSLTWEPAQPLALGGRYLLSVGGLQADSSGGTFEVVTRVEPFDEGVQVGSLSVEPTLIETGFLLCLGGATDACGSSMPHLATHRKAGAKATVSMTNLAEKSGQWRYLATLSSDRDFDRFEPLNAGNGYRFEQSYRALQARYCAKVEAFDLVGEERLTIYEECKDVDVTPLAAQQASSAERTDYGARCWAQGGQLDPFGEALVRRTDADENPLDQSDSHEASGCQLAGNRSHILTAVIVLFALGLGAGWRRRE